MKDLSVIWDSRVEKQLAKIPSYLRDKFHSWIFAVKMMGLSEVRKLSGFHDEPLKGTRQGERSVRLNKAYRVIYKETSGGNKIVIKIIKVSKHEY